MVFQPVQLTKQYMINVVLEDSAHYMLFACNFYAHKPTTVVGVIPTLYCVLQSTAFLLTMLQVGYTRFVCTSLFFSFFLTTFGTLRKYF